jgi:hypothetical protein
MGSEVPDRTAAQPAPRRHHGIRVDDRRLEDHPVVPRLLEAGLGLLLVLAGIAMLALPGPGWLSIAFGVALTLSQWPRGRRALAGLRVRLRERYGSPRVRRIEARIPNEVCPPSATAELRTLAETPIPPPAAPEPR